LNLTLGSVIFGLLWNTNLTKRAKGVSHIVLIVGSSLMLAQAVVSLLIAMFTGLLYSQSTTAPTADRTHSATTVVDTTANNPTVATDRRSYADNETGTTFQVPSDWVETPLDEERTYIDIKWFMGEEGNEELAVMYGSYDLWNDMTDEERAGLRPSDIDNSFFTKSDIEYWVEYGGISVDKVEMVAYGDNTFYKLTATVFEDTSTVYLYSINNGYMYLLQFFEFQEPARHYDEFEAFAASLTFP
jgi:hypothetical protein